MCVNVINSGGITLKGLGYMFILQYTVQVVVVDNAGSDLLYCNNDPH